MLIVLLLVLRVSLELSDEMEPSLSLDFEDHSDSAASSHVKDVLEVVEVDSEIGSVDQKPNKLEAPALACPSSARFVIPDTFDDKTLSILYGWDSSKPEKERRWKCPLAGCSASDSNRTRMVEHVLGHFRGNLTIRGLLPIVEAHVAKHCLGKSAVRFNDIILRIKGVKVEQTGTLTQMLQSEASVGQGYVECLAKCVISGGLPLTVCESEWCYDLMQESANHVLREIAKARKGASTSEIKFLDKLLQTGEKLQARNHTVSRNTLRVEVDKQCVSIINRARSEILNHARSIGATQVSDGRSNINNDALLVFAVCAGPGFLPQGAHNAGTEKKDAQRLAELHVSYLESDMELAAETFAVVTDGAAACISATERVANTEFTSAIVCQAHRLSLVLKHVALGPFKAMTERAVELISIIRSRPRVHSLVKEKCGRTVIRVVPTRFATHVIAFNRLLLIRGFLPMLEDSETYIAYKQQLSARDRAPLFDMEATINDQTFWGTLKSFLNVCSPVTMALRLMDQRVTRAKDVKHVWQALGNNLASVLLSETTLDLGARREVFRIFTKYGAEANKPVFDAAWALDPANLTDVRALAGQVRSEEDRATWLRIKRNTLAVLELAAKRKALMDSRMEARATQESKRVRTDAEESTSRTNVIDMDAVLSMAERHMQNLETEFIDYFTRRGEFARRDMSSIDDWPRTDGLLGFFALRIVNFACTISNVERLHKAYSLIHTSARNRLDTQRADRLTIARLVHRIESLPNLEASWMPEHFEAFLASRDRLDMEASAWSEQVCIADIQTSQAIQTPSTEDGVVLGQTAIVESNDGPATAPMAADTDQAVEEDSDLEECLLDSSNAITPAADIASTSLREAATTLGLYGQYM